MQKLKAVDVFTPGSFPSHTYVGRAHDDVVQRLRISLQAKGQVVSLSGPSKSGKTVLVEKVVGRENLISITGAGIERADQVWERVLAWMGTPTTQSTARTHSGSGTLTGTVTAEAGGLIAKGSVQGSASATAGVQDTVTTSPSPYMLMSVVREIADSDFVLLIDDFHYMSRDAQVEAAKQLKEAARLGVKIVTAAVPHRADDVVRANPELRGRVTAIDLNYWRREELEKIGHLGFGVLNVFVQDDTVRQFAREAAGSPQLMQSICLYACLAAGVEHTLPTADTKDAIKPLLKAVLSLTATSVDFRSLVDVLDAGPKTRGTERKIYRFRDGTEGDVYRCGLKAIAAEPLRLSFDYGEINERVQHVCTTEAPGGSSIVGTLGHMTNLALNAFARERVIEYDEGKSVLDIPDPYLLFYLRWSGRLKEDEATT